MSAGGFKDIVTDGMVFQADASNGLGDNVTNVKNIVTPTQTGTFTNGAGVVDNSYTFDGVNDYVDFGNILNLEWDAPRTISAWIKVNNNTQSHTILSNFQSIQPYRGWGMVVNIGNKLGFVMGSTQSNWANSGFTVRTQIDDVPTDIWTNVVVTYDGSGSKNGVVSYVDIDSKSFSTFTGTDITSGTSVNTSPIFIGSGIDTNTVNTPINFINGSIGSIRVYNRVLSLSEITQNYEATKHRFS